MTTVITSVAVTTGDNLNLTAGQDLYVAPSALVASQSGYGILADEGGHAIDIYGAVYGEDAGILLTDIADTFGNSRIIVGVGGSVGGRVVGIQSEAGSHSISVAGIVTGNDGIDHSGGGSFSLHNSGSIIGSFGNGLRVNSSFGNIVNTGLIESTFAGDGVILDNTTTTGGVAPKLTNFGTIRGPFTAIQGDNSNRDTILNFGNVIGDISVNGEDDFVRNAGTVVGEIGLGSGNDTYDGRGGTVSEQVEGGTGDDTYIINDETISLFELAGGGTDSVKSAVSYTLEENFEALALIGSADINGAGNIDANTITGNTGANLLFGDAGDDTINGRSGADTVEGGGGSDTLTGGFGDDRVLGGNGNDGLRGGSGDDVLAGGNGNDRISGDDGDDRLRGGGGNDRLTGGAGDDIQTGGAGRDDFIFADDFGIDVITDFNAFDNGEDINLQAVGSISDFADLVANHMTQLGNDVLIDAGGGNTITVRGVDIGDMNAGDFLF